MENKDLMAMNEELDNIEVTDLETYEDSEVSGNGLGKIVGGLLLLGGAAAAGFVYKNRAKIEERKIEKLRKKGYVIYKEEDLIEGDSDVVDEEVVDTEDDIK